jgi:UDP-glucose 4-epimerase
MKCLVTGGSGFLGSHVADMLSAKGFEVTIFDKKKSPWLKKSQKFIKGNLLNFKKLEKVVKNNQVIFHFAALSDLNEALLKPLETVKFNILGTIYLLELAKKYKINRFVYASSIYVNSHQGGFYRSSKKAAEDYVEEYHLRYGINYTILRYGSLYGERSDFNNGLKKIVRNSLIKKKVVYYGNNKTERKYIHVKDAAKVTAGIIKNKFKNKHIILSGNKSIKIKNVLNSLSGILGLKEKAVFKNEKLFGHYIKTPYTYKPKYGSKFLIKKSLNFKKGLVNLVNEVKKELKL